MHNNFFVTLPLRNGLEGVPGGDGRQMLQTGYSRILSWVHTALLPVEEIRWLR